MISRENNDVLAGEFVLGTLDAEERAAVAARRRREPSLDQAIREWEERLSPLAETVRPIEPRPDLFNQIEMRLAVRRVARDSQQQFASLQSRIRRWRTTAYAAMAAAACLMIALALPVTRRTTASDTYVAVFQQGDATPAFLLTVDLKSRELSIRAVAAPIHVEKSYQLWIASELTGGAPKSLGVIDTIAKPSRHILANLDADVVERATFGVSLEPLGGSPTDRPTGPVFHAKLIPAPR